MATLTPAELATLLGPQSANEITIAPAPIADSNRWDGFGDRFAKSLTARLRPLVRAAALPARIKLKTLSAEHLPRSTDIAFAAGWTEPFPSAEALGEVARRMTGR